MNPRSERRRIKMLDFLRGSVRPILAYIFSIAFVVLVFAAALGYIEKDLAGKIVIAFLPIASMIAALYFQSRNSKGE